MTPRARRSIFTLALFFAACAIAGVILCALCVLIQLYQTV